jgi:hypothetical protein
LATAEEICSIVKNMLSEEMTSARTQKGNGSNGLNPGTIWRFARLQPEIIVN